MAWCAGGLGFRQNWSRVRTKNEGDLGLKQGNVVTFGRRDVPENVKNQHRDVPEEFTINVVTLDINVATFQRR